MKQINIQRHYFRLKSEPNKLFFCTEAECDAMMNVKVVHYVRSSKDGELSNKEMTLRGNELSKIVLFNDEGLGMVYTPASNIRKLGTETPDSMGYDIHEALKNLKKAVGGSVTDFVCERLQWSREDIEGNGKEGDPHQYGYLLAEQVDAVALAIYNFESRNQTMIVGDQTGIGKGRIASSLIRYGMVNGYVPIYCTENAGLFSDNYRDLVDINCKAIPFIVNSDSGARITVLDKDDNEVSVFAKNEKGYTISDKSVKEKIYRSGKLPEGYDYILTTYSQLSDAYKDDKETKLKVPGPSHLKFEWLKKIAPKAIFIFDESHNISGSKVVNTSWDPNNPKIELDGSNVFVCFNQLAKMAKGVLFLSATFAKRPENMIIYANKTCMSEAGLKDVELVDAIASGGEALQEIISADIVHEGQMIRRETRNDGSIKVNYICLNKEGAAEFGVPDLEAEHTAKCDLVTELLNKINAFEQAFIVPYVEEMSGKGAKTGQGTRKTNKNIGASHTPVFSKLFMIVNQLLFAVKAGAVADHAVRRLKEQKKVVIGLSSTMETFLDRITEEYGIEVNGGKTVKCDFAMVLKSALIGTLKIIVEDNETGEKSVSWINPAQISPEASVVYTILEKEIEQTSSGITLSPIDLITQRIENAGYKVAEVTGRTNRFILSNEDGTEGEVVTRRKVKRNIAFGQFQNNVVDVLIINASGATGASAHATTKNTHLKPEEVKARVMIIAQTELDVNKEVQKRGRINRTGQIKELPPSYDYISSAVPAEKRLMMMLQKKLKSLDANTTSNQKQSTNVIDTDDFMNKYGNEVCTQYLRENDDVNAIFNNVVKPEEKEDKLVDIYQITGWVPLLSCKKQEEFYETILAQYKDYVERLRDEGNFDLEVEAMDLDAELIGKLQVLVASSAGQSRFSDAAYIGNYDCKVLRKPMSQSDIKAIITKYLDGEDAKDKANRLAQGMREYYQQKQIDDEAKIAEKYKNKRDAKRAAILEKGGSEKDVEFELVALNNQESEEIDNKRTMNKNAARHSNLLEFFHAGRACYIDRQSNLRGICLGTKIGSRSKNPYAPSNVNISFAVASSQKTLSYNMTAKTIGELQKIYDASSSLTTGYDNYGLDARYLEDWPSMCKEATSDREVRQIIVGNILRAYKNKPEGGRLISFTTKNGEVLKGILAPRSNKEASQKQILSKYPINQLKDAFKKAISNEEDILFSMTQGTEILYRAYDSQLVFSIRNQSTFKALSKSRIEDFNKLDRTGRAMRYAGYSTYETVVSSDKLDELFALLDSCNLQVELFPSQVEHYMPNGAGLKTGNWKPIKFDKKHIPTKPMAIDVKKPSGAIVKKADAGDGADVTEQKNDEAEAVKAKAKRVRLAKAKSKAALALAQAKNNN